MMYVITSYNPIHDILKPVLIILNIKKKVNKPLTSSYNYKSYCIT